MTELYNSKGMEATVEEVIEWWLYHYEGFEHLTEGGTTNPETWYTVTTILQRCLKKIRDSQK